MLIYSHFRRFALEMTFQDPNLFEIKKIGHDLDNAVADNLYCTQHLHKADGRHLPEMVANKRMIERIMADIYGSQNGCAEELGLADASDDEDFGVKLLSLKSILDELLPNFHLWFVKNISEKFKRKFSDISKFTPEYQGSILYKRPSKWPQIAEEILAR